MEKRNYFTQSRANVHVPAITDKQKANHSKVTRFTLRWSWIFTCIGIVLLLLIVNFIILYFVYNRSDSTSAGIPPMLILFSEMLLFL